MARDAGSFFFLFIFTPRRFLSARKLLSSRALAASTVFASRREWPVSAGRKLGRKRWRSTSDNVIFAIEKLFIRPPLFRVRFFISRSYSAGNCFLPDNFFAPFHRLRRPRISDRDTPFTWQLCEFLVWLVASILLRPSLNPFAFSAFFPWRNFFFFTCLQFLFAECSLIGRGVIKKVPILRVNAELNLRRMLRIGEKWMKIFFNGYFYIFFLNQNWITKFVMVRIVKNLCFLDVLKIMRKTFLLVGWSFLFFFLVFRGDLYWRIKVYRVDLTERFWVGFEQARCSEPGFSATNGCKLRKWKSDRTWSAG